MSHNSLVIKSFLRKSILGSTLNRLNKPTCLVNIKERLYSTKKYAPPGRFSYVSVPGEVPLLDLTMGQLIDHAAKKFGDQEAIVVSAPTEVRRTFDQVKKEADHLAAGLLSLGLKKGDRVGLWGPNSYEWYLTHAAGMKAGLVIVNINPAYQTREVGYCLNKVGIKCMVIADKLKSSNYYDLMAATVPELEKSDPGKINSSVAPQLTSVVSFASKPLKGAFSFEEILHRGTKGESQKVLQDIEKVVQFDDVCNIQFTSGTTGNPKGVMLSHHNRIESHKKYQKVKQKGSIELSNKKNLLKALKSQSQPVLLLYYSLVNNGFLVGRRFSYSEKDKLCLPVPLFHCFGSVVGLIAGIHSGATVVLPSPSFSPKDILHSISKERCTVVYGTPTMHIDVLHVPDFENYDVSSLRLAVTAGSICPEELIRLMKTKYTVDNVGSCYGMTETAPVSFQSLPNDSDKLRAETVGYPLENTEVKVVNTEGEIVEIGQEGELCIRGYLNMLGYWEDPGKTNETIDPARWLRTGDLTVINESGHCRIVGRLKDMIIRGGENVYPREIEDFLHTHPAVQEAQVFGVPDTRMGEEIAAFICFKEGQAFTQEELKAFCKGKIAHFKIPRYVTFTKDFPKTVSGKCQKFVMRERTIAEFKIEDKFAKK